MPDQSFDELIIEIMAQGFWESETVIYEWGPQHRHRVSWEDAVGRSLAGVAIFRQFAAASLSALREAGYEVVPREPTEEMISAVLPYDVGEAKSRPAGKMISDVWRAMINAFHPTSSTYP